MPLKKTQRGPVTPTGMAQGDAVTNVKCPDWGTGVIVSIGHTNSVEVQFPVVGQKRLLMEVLAASSEPAPALAKKSKKPERRAPRTSAAR